ncbi:MAG TPA: hypothetical protein VFY44_07675 [Thermoleophilaceae bacterium]|nr:hypothetical protein [Thermoleophilaceae bacterium]
MNFDLHKLLATLAVAAPLALAGTANAAEPFGSDLTQTHRASNVDCASYPCTLAQDFFEGWDSGYVRSTGVITGWKVKLNAGAKARLKVIREGDWNQFTATGTGPSVNGTGGISSVATRIPVSYGDYAGVELQSGLLQTDFYGSDSTTQEMRFQGAFNDGQTREPGSQPIGHELMTQVTVEPDADEDGYGDETQDGCVFCNTGAGGGEVLPPSSSGGSSSYSPGRGSGSSSSSDSSYGANRPLMKLAIDKRGFFEYRNGTPYITLYMDNQGRKNLEGSIELKYGKKALSEVNKGVNKKFDIDWDDQKSLSNFKLPRKLVKQIERKGAVTLTATARMEAPDGARTTTKQTVKVRKAGLTNAYDGYYKGTGGLVIQVSGGYLTSISVGLNAYCQRDAKFMMRSLYTLDGYPLMIGRDGSFKASGSQSPDTVKYEGKLTRKGTGKGYLSLFHTKLDLGDGGRLQIDQCFAASNWKVQKVKGK